MTAFDKFSILLLIGFVGYCGTWLYKNDVLGPTVIMFVPIVAVLIMTVWLINNHKRRKKELRAALGNEEITEIFGRMHQYCDDAEAAIDFMSGRRKDLPPDRPVPLREEQIVIDPQDSLENQVISYILQSQTTSVAPIQRQFGIGMTKTKRLLKDIESLGIIGEYRVSPPREIKLSYEEWIEKRSYYDALRMER
ncbi:Ftsk gamma domain-containing protein [Ruminococcaceae bacterium FB2012]|nr:Ftsk gamma domain-containing protein [Ruminococcaceae bacterium FB2012]